LETEFGLCSDCYEPIHDLFGWGNHCLLLYDEDVQVWDHTIPEMTSSLESLGGRVALRFGQNAVIVGQLGLFVVDLSDPASISVLGSRDVGTELTHAVVHDGLILARGGTDSYFVFDLSDPAAPELAANRPLPVPCGPIQTENDLLYACGGGIIGVFSLANPLEPVLLGSTAALYDGSAMAVRNGGVYLAGGHAGLLVYDASDPEDIQYRGGIADCLGKDVQIHDDLVFVACNDSVQICHLDCATLVPLFLSFFQVQLDGPGISATWQTGGGGPSTVFRLVVEGAGVRQVVPYQETGSSQYRAFFEPGTELGGETLTFSLSFRKSDGTWARLASREIQVPSFPVELFPPPPHPSNPQVTVSFSLDRPQHANISVFDLAGRFVCNLHDQWSTAGIHMVEWNGRDHGGKNVSSGAYLVRMTTESHQKSRKIMLVR